MEVAVILGLSTHHRACRDGRLGDHLVRDGPLEFGVLEVANALLLDAVTDADVDALRSQHAVDLFQHLLGVGAGAVTAKNRVESALVDDGIEGTVLVLELAHIHLLVDECGEALLVLLGHLLHDGEGDVDVANVLVPILKHLLGEACNTR